MFLEHDVIMCATNGSPLIIGQGDGEIFVSSDPHALAMHTQKVVYMDDGYIATLTTDDITMSNMHGSYLILISLCWKRSGRKQN